MPTDFQYDVFLSHNSADKPRVRRLAERLRDAGLRVWFDEWIIQPGDDIYLAIERGLEASRTLVLCLSPAALGSDWARLERSTVLFGDPAKTGRRVIPLLLADCKLPDSLRHFKYVDYREETDAAFEELLAACSGREERAQRGDDREAEQATQEARGSRSRKFESKGSEAGASTAAVSSVPEIRFSKGAEAVLKRARELAERSQRAGVTSSCILFAFADLATSRADTCRFIREILDRTGEYDAAFSKFLDDSGKAERQAVRESGDLLGMVSENVWQLLIQSAKIALRVSGSLSDVHQRHLLGALLTAPQASRRVIARGRLEALGLELPTLCREFREFIRSQAGADDSAEWDAILTPKVGGERARSPYIHGPAGFTPDFCGVGGSRAVPDFVGVKAIAHRLADLIALRETKLPLAVGLFGDWGSGKSHFMNLMDRRLKELTQQAREQDSESSSVWCREIVPIYFNDFNAWHYVDANLWASLVAQIFESLFTYLRPKRDDLENVQKLLEQATGATARAAEELALAQIATQKAESELHAAKEIRRHEETVVDGLLHGLRSLLPNMDSAQLRQHAAQLLGVQKEMETIDDLRGVVHEARSLGGRTRALWNAVLKRPGRGWRLAWLVAAIGIIPCISVVAAEYLPYVRDLVRNIGRGIAALLVGLPGVVLWIRSILKETSRWLKKIEEWQKQAETAQRQAQETAEMKKAKANVNAATAKEESARIRLTEAAAKEKQLEDLRRSLAPERRLSRFIEERAQSAVYRGQLGLVSLARRDFQELSDIFADAEALKARVAELQETKQTDKQKEAEQLEKLSKSVDRIVLFVDDLDRCQPEKVVDVLQAVHLLLAFPLFAVVVGVDQRCLRQSLRMQFRGLLTPDGKNLDQEDQKFSVDQNDRPATPLDYLEKIFHVPFHLPPMGESGYASLIENLTELPVQDQGKESEPAKLQAAGKTPDAAYEQKEALAQRLCGESGTPKR